MKVIMKEDVERVGYAGDVKEVADGFARNFLLPRGLALKATQGALKDLELRRGAIERKHADAAKRFAAVLTKISAEPLVLTHKTGEEGKLHGAVTTTAIAEALQAKYGVEIGKEVLSLPEPIKAVGKYAVHVKLHRDVTGQVEVHVLSDQPVVKAPAAPEPEVVEAAAAPEVSEEVPTPEEEGAGEATDEE